MDTDLAIRQAPPSSRGVAAAAAAPLPPPDTDTASCVDLAWLQQWREVTAVGSAVAKASAQDPLQYRSMAVAALRLAARPADHGVDRGQAAALCVRMMG